jgi:hypothetical protein
LKSAAEPSSSHAAASDVSGAAVDQQASQGAKRPEATTAPDKEMDKLLSALAVGNPGVLRALQHLERDATGKLSGAALSRIQEALVVHTAHRGDLSSAKDEKSDDSEDDSLQAALDR